ncbi:unnamed protein product [Vitrella brassicaformis CCMP3155]|uniref:O-phosphoseryl-tRNA(Sec) selenium transferase n=1 Tax=Vitrella brassicaformis (strain CCMP3155) TaxID=1169540 RepID=A0A0G4G1W0_VITBC|nr:unnamed protein product [Vitrella brassicaformis CCMP3155]|mmetsp:Transcript_38308/g.109433  ORF Transcript_38308/g.109433 Transcript_38308/m.109433 type:complete len:525 (-) Transcript_38308:79-1653(-)|eukprot:CEM21871.1 unnamed protein product [Vitrella brassicaformis CCMP3155]
MNEKHFELIEGLVGKRYADQALQARRSRAKLLSVLLTHRKLPSEGWDDLTVQALIHEIAAMDSNNFLGNVGVGEREGRVYSSLVKQRHFYLTHGIGRSGNIMDLQPKAAGSSLINQLTTQLALDAIQQAGIKAARSCVVMPLATGMALTMCYLTLRHSGPPTARYVVWSRIDQKACFKAIITAGFEPLVVPLMRDGDALCTDVPAIEAAIARVGADSVLCVSTTTSTFAPRVPDSVDQVAQLCSRVGVPHIVNNAYGLQCSKCCHLVETAIRTGRVDAFVQSTDKNFMVPVGGSIVASGDTKFIDSLSQLYAGRASMSPTLDLFMTLLSMGADGWRRLRDSRKELAVWFKQEMDTLAHKHGCRMLDCPANKISFVMDITALKHGTTRGGSTNGPTAAEDGGVDSNGRSLTSLGSMLFTHRCSGPRVVLAEAHPPTRVKAKLIDGSHDDNNTSASASAAENSGGGESDDGRRHVKVLSGHRFANYGAHSDDYPFAYLTVACAIGATKDELQVFLKRLDETLTDFK